VHPPDVMAPLLEELGIVATYWTGDSGSGPGRAFWDGRLLAPSLIHFPVMPLRAVASLGEMEEAPDLPEAEVGRWLAGTADFCARQRTVRLIYSHPYDLYAYDGPRDFRPVLRTWLDDLAARQAAGELQVRPMAEFARFMQRMLRTDAAFRPQPQGLAVSLANAEGLRDVTVAVPCAGVTAPSAGWLRVETDGRWYYVVITDDRREANLVFPRLPS
jgi:hypothetical protein